jgi:hypothetical protein
MKLMISHLRSLEIQKWAHGCFETVRGELCISSIAFARHGTNLCLAFQDVQHKTEEKSETIAGLLSKAGRYKALLDERDLMSLVIVVDVEARDIYVAMGSDSHHHKLLRLSGPS